MWPFVTWFTENIFREDKEIVEYEQRAYDAQGADWNNEVFPADPRPARRAGPLRQAHVLKALGAAIVAAAAPGTS